METSKPSLQKGKKKMGLPAPDLFTGRHLVDHITATIEIRPTMLAALLSVTERTLSNWYDVTVGEDMPPKFARLHALYQLVCFVEGKIQGKVILNFLNEPIPETGGSSLLDYVVNDPNNALIMSAAKSVMQEFE